MIAHHSSGFAVDDITVGPFAHGFGTTDDGRPFAFRTVRSTLVLEIYRADLDSEVPAPEDVVAVAQARVTDVDINDERSVVALVRDLIPGATAVACAADREVTAVRTLLGRISAVIDGM